MVREFTPQKLANTINQDLIYYFIDYLEQRLTKNILWIKHSPEPLLTHLFLTQRYPFIYVLSRVTLEITKMELSSCNSMETIRYADLRALPFPFPSI